MAQEALSGAASGAAAGTAIFPGWGTVIGAGLGLASGFMGRKDSKRAARQQAAQQLKQDEVIRQQLSLATRTQAEQERVAKINESLFAPRNASAQGIFQQRVQALNNAGPLPEEAALTLSSFDRRATDAARQVRSSGAGGLGASRQQALSLGTARDRASLVAQLGAAQRAHVSNERNALSSVTPLSAPGISPVNDALSTSAGLFGQRASLANADAARASQVAGQGFAAAGQVAGGYFQDQVEAKRYEQLMAMFRSTGQGPNSTIPGTTNYPGNGNTRFPGGDTIGR